MSTEFEDPVIPDDEDQEDQDGTEDAGSLISVLRARHKEIRETDYHLDLPVPGYNNLIWIRFKPFRVKDKKSLAIARRFDRGDEGVLLDAALQNLIDGCDQVMLLPESHNGNRGEDGENLVPIDDELPIKFDARLNDVLQLGVDTRRSRDIVLELFPTEQSIIDMSTTLTRWLRDVTKDLNESFLGE